MRFRVVLKAAVVVLACHLAASSLVIACSTFMLRNGEHLIFAHNLNENGIDVPGMIFINKRGIFKTGRTWSEVINKDRSNPSSLTWISSYGSVTFNVFGRDFPDGGMNEAGLYIWEMSERADYPRDESFPKLMHMNWMQFVLDSYSTVDAVIESAQRVEIDGWNWHFFVADARGACASIEFFDGRAVIHQGEAMPVPALFNEPYEREMEVLGFFEGFGGSYPVDLGSMHTPRVAKTAAMLRDYPPGIDPVEYGLHMLDTLKVAEVPKWSVVFDVVGQAVHFKTRLHPSVKKVSLDGIDFSNATPVQILNIDIAEGGEVDAMLHPYDDDEVMDFLMALPLPDGFFSQGGLTRRTFCERATTYWHEAEDPGRQHFRGRWVQAKEVRPGQEAGDVWTVELLSDGNRVTGTISRPSRDVVAAPLDHLRLEANDLSFTFRRSPGGKIYEFRATLDGDRMEARLLGTEDDYGSMSLERAP